MRNNVKMSLKSPVIFIILCIIFSIQVNAQDHLWQTVSIPEICSFQIPDSLELQSGTYKIFNDTYEKIVYKIISSPERVIAQPKGINAFDPQALKLYSRVIVETTRGKKGDYNKLNTSLSVSKEELLEIDAMYKKEIQKSASIMTTKSTKMELLSWQPAKIVKINGVDIFKIAYTRSINDAPPVIVNMYLIQNNDLFHSITISWRINEKNLWSSDFSKIINTFSFNN